MTQQDAEHEAQRRWGPSGRARLRAPSLYKGRGGPGRLARYRYVVGNGKLGVNCSILGQGNSWVEAFEDARPRVTGRQAY
jgi:hypothetical protein